MTSTVNTKYAYAGDVKQMILDTPRLFVTDDDNTAIWFEKEIVGNYSVQHTIADCLIFSEQQGLIGVEIKSARDSKKRLRRQLTDYVKVCDYVWVLIHDTMLPEVEGILEDFPYVGVICYTEVNDKLAPGVVKQAQPSPQFNLKESLDMLWSNELYVLDKQASLHSGGKFRVPPKYKITTKKGRIGFLTSMGEQYAHDEFMKLIISGYKDKDRSFDTYDFRRQ